MARIPKKIEDNDNIFDNTENNNNLDNNESDLINNKSPTATPENEPYIPNYDYINKAKITTIIFKTPTGQQLKGEFAVTDKLKHVKDYLIANCQIDKPFHMMTVYPKHYFSNNDFEKTLLDLDLVPSATIIIGLIEDGGNNNNNNNDNRSDANLQNNNGLYSYFSYVKDYVSSFFTYSTTTSQQTQESDNNQYINKKDDDNINNNNNNNNNNNRGNPIKKRTGIHSLGESSNNSNNNRKNDSDKKDSDSNSYYNGNSTQFNVNCNENNKELIEKNDINRNITELIQARGYICEEHKVITKDGYILKLFRIPNKRYDLIKKPGKPVVLLQHGFEDLGTTWVNQENVYQSLGFLLADSGFDVWIGNSRGTLLGDEHLTLSVYDNEYWNFTFNEMAEYDLPAMVDLILKITKKQNLSYIGHSQGSTIGFISFNSQNQINLKNKINLFIALGPVARLTNSSVAEYFTNIPLFKNYLKLFNSTSFLYSTSYLQKPAGYICILVPSICLFPIEFLEGKEYPNQLNKTRIPVYVSHSLGGSSTKNTLHWLQVYDNEEFKQFDYGSPNENLKYYNQKIPPVYNVSLNKIPTIFYGGTQDTFSSIQNIKWLSQKIKNLLYYKIIENYTHVDYIWGVNAYKDVYYDFLPYLLKYNNK